MSDTFNQLVGVHRGMPAADYHALPGASASVLRHLARHTPAETKAERIDQAWEPNIAAILGTLTHHLLLEPERPLPLIAIKPETYPAPADCSAVKQKKCQPGDPLPWHASAHWCKCWLANEAKAGRIALSKDEHDSIVGMCRSVGANRAARELLLDCETEVTVISKVETSQASEHVGFPVRCRLDMVPSGPNLADLKSTGIDSLDDRALANLILAEGYHIQAAFYLALWNSVAGKDAAKTGFSFIFVRRVPPFVNRVVELDGDWLALGREEMEAALTKFVACSLSGNWPGYPEDTTALALPAWARKQLRE